MNRDGKLINTYECTEFKISQKESEKRRFVLISVVNIVEKRLCLW